MNIKYLSAALMAAGFLIAAPAFAQTSPASKQPTQEGGPSMPMPCGLPYNANPSADPDCKQRTQNLSPSPLQAAQEATGNQKEEPRHSLHPGLQQATRDGMVPTGSVVILLERRRIFQAGGVRVHHG